MLRVSFLKSAGLSVAAALAFAAVPFAGAQTADAVAVKVVANPTARPIVTGTIDNSKLVALKPFDLPEGAKDMGPVDPSKTMTLELRLKRPQVLRQAITALRRQVQDPTSPWYGKTLTPVEFAQSFGLAASDLEAVSGWLEAQGFKVGNADNGRMYISFSGTVAQVEAVFHTGFHNYAAKDGSERFAPTTALQVPYALRGVVGHVAGIENFRDFRAATFPGPVTDFPPGTTVETASVATSGTSIPNPEGELLHDSSFTTSSPAIGIGGRATLNVRLGGNTHPATGSLTIVNESTGLTVAHIADITTCAGYDGGYGRSCTMEFAPKGAGTAFLKAVYSGDEHERGTVIGYTIISFVGSQNNYSTITITSAVSTYMVYSGAGNTTFASNIYYGGGYGTAAPAATGTYSLDYYDYDGDEAIIVNAANLTGCTTTTASHTVSCSNAVSGSQLSSDSALPNYMQMDLVYSGDSNYASSSNAVFGYDATGSSSTLPTSITLNGSFTTTHTYGASATDSGVTGLTIVSPASPNAGYSLCDSIDDVVGTAPVGWLGAYENAGVKTNTSYTLNFTEPAITIPALLTPGTYPISAIYAGDKNFQTSTTYCTYGPLASTATVTLTEAKQAPTVAMTTPTAAVPTTQLSGQLAAFTVTGTLTWTGTGIAPNPANVTFASTAAGSFGTVTCTAANSSTTFPTSPYTCSATFTPTSNDAAGPYNINLSFATDTNYLAESTSVTGNYIIASDSTSLTASPASIVYGGGPVTITDTISIAHGGTAPAGTIALTINAATTSIGSITVNTTNCPLTSGASVDTYACTYSWTPPAADTVGSYTITGVYTSSNYSNQTSTTPFAISKQMPTFGTMTFSPAASEPYGTAQAITISDTLAYTGGGSAPTGAVKFVLNAVTYTATCTGSSTPLTCTYTVPAATIAALAAGSYTVTATYTTDTNYAAATGTSGTFTITPATPTLTLATQPISSPYGSTAGVTVTANSTGTTGTVTFTLTAGYGSLSATTCTLSAGTCTVTFTPNGTTPVNSSYSPFLSASVAANGNYNASNTATDTLSITPVTPTVTFSPSPITSAYQSTAAITVTVSTSPADTGTVTFSGSYATYGTLSATTCVLSSGSCSVTFTPNGTTAIGSYSNILTATIPANANLNQATASDSLTISKQYTAMAVTVSPVVFADGTDSGAFTTVLAWTNPALEPTGTIAIADSTNSRNIGTITLSSTGAAIASTACTTAGSVGTCTYTCAAKVDLAISCTVTNTATSGTNTTATVADSTETNLMTATYSGDANFASVAGTAYLYNEYSYALSDFGAGTLTISGTAIANATYGLTQAESPTVKIVTYEGENPNAGAGFLEVYSTGAIGTPYETGLSSCTTSGCLITTTWTVPAVVAPGSYTLTYYYSGDFESSSGDTYYASTTGSLTVNKQTPTLGTVSFSPASSEPYGTSQAITISDTLSWLGIGEAPQGAVTFVLNGVTYTATCTALTTTSENCSAVVPAATIAALTPNSYTVTAAYATDTNYAACNGTSATFTITAATASLTLSAATAGTTTTGTTSSVVTVTLSPAVANVPVTITDSTTTNGIYSGATNSSGQASFTLTTSTTGVAAGLNNLVATSSSTSYVTAATSNTLPVYLQGILLASSLNHNFTSFTAGESGVDGTYDGSPICNGSNGVNGQTCTTGYSVAVTNFTTSSQVITATLGTLADNAFSYATNCPANGLAAGAKCQFVFYYLPPYGDGCNPSTNCTTFVSGGTTYTQGTFEETTWKITSGSLLEGLYFSGTTGGGQLTVSPAMLEGKAVLASGNYLTVTPSSMTFGPQAPNTVSATQNITVTNTSSAAVSGIAYTLPGGTFTTNNQCGATLAAGATCQIQVSYSGTTVTTNTGTVTITPPSPETALSVSLSGTTVATGETLSLTTTTHNFGNVTTGTTVTFGLGITNNSTDTAATLSFVAPASNGFTFNTSGCPNPLPVSSSCQIQVSFTPTSVTSYSQNLTISSNLEILPGGTTTGPTYTNTVAFTGSGVAGGQLAATSTGHNFGNTAVGSEATAYGVVLTNNTAVALTLSLGPLSNTTEGYTYATNCPATLAVNSNCNLVFYYTPNAVGLTQVTFPVTATDGSNTYQMNGSVAAIALSGTGQ